jgi:hypothetical protein
MKSRDWGVSSKRVAVITVVVVLVAGCGPTVYQRAYDYCRGNGGQEYECDRFARDEVNHAQQQTAEQIMRGQQAIGGGAARQPTPPASPTYECSRATWRTVECRSVQ